MHFYQMFSNILVLSFLSIAGIGFSAEHTKDSEVEVKKNLADGTAILLDVREISEWKDAHLTSATSLPLSDLKTGKGMEKLPKDKIIYLHCHSGKRVIPAAELLKSAGFKDVRPLSWGYPQLAAMKFK